MAGAWWYDLTTQTVRWSGGLYRLFGLDPLSVAPETTAFIALVHPDDRAAVEQALRDPLREVAPEPAYRIIRPDGELRWLKLTCRIVHDRGGLPTHMIGVALDVTACRHAETSWRRQVGQIEALYRLVRLLLRQPVPADSGHLRWHRAAQLAQGWDAEAEIHPEDRAEVATQWQEANRRLGDYAVAYRRALPVGGYETVLSRAVPVTDGSGRIEDWLGVTGRAAGAADAADALLTPALLRAARAYLGWTSDRLAQRSLLSLSTIRRMEAGQAASLSGDNRRAVIRALHDGGVRIRALADGGVAVVPVAESAQS